MALANGKTAIILNMLSDSEKALTCPEITEKAGLSIELHRKLMASIISGLMKKQSVYVAERRHCPISRRPLNAYKIKED
jgi:hypothetical protein